VSTAEGWATDPIRGAGGRRRYHRQRRDEARRRQVELMQYINAHGLSPYTVPGTQRRLAEVFGVSPSTVCGDLRQVFARHPG
jgi:hypothetical protein